ncbi:LacI family DNA-binding transcriptional regulator [Streptomyces sp. DSM 44915]|uniref:LacI family DNA-binding transcriptional regulator n=1 Tax=Streptomyces chisholmiae TaxID=3075540 RepID=A0ABU2JXJ6_9ACTN|nr:LacI family DNA-binding transcriptional regulator [Streptomyces sp. DSM 44915]MDT0269690.1 LacI family DNA-binding transcriptional regulator [Streptomyces sp. DSM 44915]
MVTMSDVAKAAGVSVMTVSNVINGHRYVSDETRRKVTEAIERLGYRMNLAARNLRSGNTGVIGLAVPDLDQPYYGQLAALLVAEARRRGYRVAIEQTGASREGEAEALVHSRLRMYDGLIIATVEVGDAEAGALFADFPVVALGERISTASVDHVGMANYEGARAATRHLLEVGCRRIASVGGRTDGAPGAATLRTSGYLAALREAGIDADERLVLPCAFVSEAGAAAVRRLAADGVPFDGVMCMTDTIAMGVLRGLADLGIGVPAEVAVIGFDDISQATFTVPALSTVAPGHVEMVNAALDMLVERVKGTRPEGVNRQFTGPHRLVVRESTRR